MKKDKILRISILFSISFLIVFFIGKFLVKTSVKDIDKIAYNQDSNRETIEDSIKRVVINSFSQAYADSLDKLKKQFEEVKKILSENGRPISLREKNIPNEKRNDNTKNDELINSIKNPEIHNDEWTDPDDETQKQSSDSTKELNKQNKSDSINNKGGSIYEKDTSANTPSIPTNDSTRIKQNNKLSSEIPESNPPSDELIDPRDFDYIKGKLINNKEPHDKIIIHEKPIEESRQAAAFNNDKKKRDFIARSKKKQTIQGKTAYWYKVNVKNKKWGYVFGIYLTEVKK